jgi:hypothetical protein
LIQKRRCYTKLFRNIDGEHCANLASYELPLIKTSLETLRDEIKEKSTDQTDTALLELVPLCQELISIAQRYEHLLSLNFVHQKTQQNTITK